MIILSPDTGRLDLFDHTAFFESFVPALVHTHPMLKYSTAAVAAKQLGRVSGVRTTKMGPGRHSGVTEFDPNVGGVDWSYKAANYYYRALSALRTVLPDQGSALQSKP